MLIGVPDGVLMSYQTLFAEEFHAVGATSNRNLCPLVTAFAELQDASGVAKVFRKEIGVEVWTNVLILKHALWRRYSLLARRTNGANTVFCGVSCGLRCFQTSVTD